MVRKAILHHDDGLLPAPLCEMVIKSMSFPLQFREQAFHGCYILELLWHRERVAAAALKPGFIAFGAIRCFRELGEAVLHLSLPLSR